MKVAAPRHTFLIRFRAQFIE